MKVNKPKNYAIIPRNDADRRLGKHTKVKDLLKYINDRKIPLNSEIWIERISDWYITKKGNWGYYKTKDCLCGYDIELLPIGNGFGWCKYKGKKKFVIWNFY